tara:strand:- start:3042 stop:3323 length:282 start_codon:yes stop_codon:yes gene_type:complete
VLGVDEVAPCSGMLVPELKLRSALSCKRVTVPKLTAERDKCLRDKDIFVKSCAKKESLLLLKIESEREGFKKTSTILGASVAVLSGILLGLML